MSPNINLLPPELRRNVFVEAQNLFRKIMVLALVSSITLSYLGFYIHMKYSEKQLSNLEYELQLLKPRVEQLQKFQKENKDLQSEIAVFKKKKNEKVDWAVILKDMNECLPEGMWVTDLSYNQDNIIRVKGMADNVSVVGVFLYQLHQLSHFSEFNLEKATEVPVGDFSLTEFNLVGKLAKGSE